MLFPFISQCLVLIKIHIRLMVISQMQASQRLVAVPKNTQLRLRQNLGPPLLKPRTLLWRHQAVGLRRPHLGIHMTRDTDKQ